MNQLKKQLLCLVALVHAAHLVAASNTTTNIVARSQSFDAARTMVGWNNPVWGINREAADDQYYTSFNLTFAYTRTFRDNHLTKCLFGDDLICSGCDNDLGFKVSGSLVPDRAPTDWLAENFGLPMDFQSTVNFNPRISNFLLDFSIYAGLDAWIDGLYFRIHGPFVHTNWNLNATECVGYPASTSQTQDLASINALYPAGYFSGTVVPAGNGTTNFLSWANGCTPDITNSDYNPYLDNDITWQSLCCSRMINSCDCDANAFTRNGFGELRFILGRNFFSEREDRDCHLGIGVYVAAPTGTRVGTSRYLFEPIIGNGKHWELGAQITGHHIWWKSEDEDRTFGIYFEANVTHLFGANQDRCFDLCSAGSSSRYMIAQRLESFAEEYLLATQAPTVPLPQPVLNPSVDPTFLQFANEYAPVANLTRREITSTIGAQGDLAISLAYRSGGFQWDVGYNFWGRSCEHIKISTDCCPVIPGTWALKGTAYVYGFDYGLNPATDPVNPGVPVPLAATDSGATIHGGSNNVASLGNTVNQGVDNNVAAFDYTTTGASHPLVVATFTNTAATIYTSNPTVLITESDFNMTGTRGISNKFFTNINWAWPDCCDSKWTPYVSLGGEVEFGSNGSPDCCNNNSCSTSTCNPCNTGCSTSSCNTGCFTPSYNYEPTPSCERLQQCCSNVALTQWGIWFKVGTSYN